MYFGQMRVIKNLDIFKLVGLHTAMNVYYPFSFRNNQIYFRGKIAPDAFDISTRSLVLKFKHLGIDNPMVNGIVLFKGKLEETDQPRLKSIKSNFDRRYKQ